MQKLIAAVGLTILAGGAAAAGNAQAHATASGAAPTVHEVQMVQTDDGNYRYIPDELTIKVGDTVRWINVSGGPHNVHFKPGDKPLPSGAEAFLKNAMPNTMGPMMGPLLVAPNATYEIDFTGAPVGEYHYVCTPHEMLGMVATLTIEE
jgi:plastocyanin